MMMGNKPQGIEAIGKEFIATFQCSGAEERVDLAVKFLITLELRYFTVIIQQAYVIPSCLRLERNAPCQTSTVVLT